MSNFGIQKQGKDTGTWGNWKGISGFNFSFMTVTDIKDTTSIYNNNRHQAVISLQLALVNGSNVALTPGSYPSIDKVLGAVRLRDYYNPAASLGIYPSGGVGTSTRGWYQSSESLGFHIKDVSQRDDSSDNYIKDGIAYLTYYVSCDDKASFESLVLGFSVTIQVGSMSSQTTVVSNADNGDFHVPLNISAIQAIEYDLNALTVRGQRVPHADEGTDGKVELSAPKVGACYRQFDYTVGFSPETQQLHNTRLFKAVIEPETPYPSDLFSQKDNPNYAFGERGLGAYGITGYFWPPNIYKRSTDMTPFSQETAFFMHSRVTGDIKTNILYKDDQLYFTLFCYGGRGANFRFTQAPFLVSFYDQYGNAGQFLVDPLKLPESYDADELISPDFSLLSRPTANFVKGETGDTAEFFNLLFEWDGRASYVSGDWPYIHESFSSTEDGGLIYLNATTSQSLSVKFHFVEINPDSQDMTPVMIVDDKGYIKGDSLDNPKRGAAAVSNVFTGIEFLNAWGEPAVSYSVDKTDKRLSWVIHPVWDQQLSVVFCSNYTSDEYTNYVLLQNHPDNDPNHNGFTVILWGMDPHLGSDVNLVRWWLLSAAK